MVSRTLRTHTVTRLFFAIIAVIVAAPSIIQAADIIVKPGRFDRFDMSGPERIVAGKDALIRLRAVDSFNNIIRDFNKVPREFTLAVSGSANVAPNVFRASDFTDGIFTFTIVNRTAEIVTLTIREKGVPLPLLSNNLRINPDRLSSFSVEGPSTAYAGEAFNVTITARDAFGNTVLEPLNGKNLNFIFKGDAEPTIDMPLMPDFKNGVSVVTLVSPKVGTAAMEVRDLIAGVSGISNKIRVLSGLVHSFAVLTPKDDIVAGEPFDVSIVALDRFGNVVTHYATTGKGISLASTGKLAPFPSTLPAHAFTNGQASLGVRYDGAENISLLVTELGGKQRGKSEAIHVDTPTVSRYEIKTPDSAVAGHKFKIRITAYNQLGRIFRNYNVLGPDVHLSVTGSGSLTPNRIPASEFVNGTAVVEVQYNISEAFTINASPVKPVVPPAVEKPVPPPVKPPAPRKEVTAAPPGVVDKPAPPPVKTPAPRKEIAVAPPAVVDKPAPPPVKTPAPRKEVVGAKKAAEKKDAKIDIDKRTLEITGISISEPKARTTISIHIPNFDETVKYEASTVTIDGANWIILQMHPIASKILKPVKLDSPFVGEVIIEEDPKKKEIVSIRIRQLKPMKFYLTRETNYLTITLRN